MVDVALCRGPDCANPHDDPDVYVCGVCMSKLGADLRAIPEVIDELLVTLTRQDAGDPGVGGRTDEPPLLYRPEASDTGRDLHAVLAVWVAHLLEARGLELTDYRPASRPDIRVAPVGPQRPPIPGLRTYPAPHRVHDTTSGRLPGPGTVELARWLARHMATIAEDVAAGQVVDEIGNAVARAWHATDRPGARAYLGPCSCVPEWQTAHQLYAHPDAVTVTCPGCGERYYVADRRRMMLKQSAKLLVTAEEAARALPALLQVAITPALLWELHRRHGLKRHPPARLDPRRRHRYQVGDIVDVLTERAAKLQRRRLGEQRQRPGRGRPNEAQIPDELRALFHQVRAGARRDAREKAQREVTDAGPVGDHAMTILKANECSTLSNDVGNLVRQR